MKYTNEEESHSVTHESSKPSVLNFLRCYAIHESASWSYLDLLEPVTDDRPRWY